MTNVADAVQRVHEQIAALDRPFDHPVELVAVTKGFGGDAIEAAAAAGCTRIGENYAQDLLAKQPEVEATGIDVHFIGQLQSNKVRQLAGIVTVWESLDRPSIIDEVARRAPGATVLIQVDAVGEPGKGGAPVADVPDLVERAGARGLHVDGLMTVGPTNGDVSLTGEVFGTVRGLVDDLGLAVCSMGMSGDLHLAVAAGSTRVRVGSAIFGPRPKR